MIQRYLQKVINEEQHLYLDLPAPEEAFVKGHGRGDGVFVGKLHVGEPLGVPVELVAQDRHLCTESIAIYTYFVEIEKLLNMLLWFGYPVD